VAEINGNETGENLSETEGTDVIDGDGVTDFGLLVAVTGGHSIVATDFVL